MQLHAARAGSGEDARERLDAALEGMRAAGLENVSGQVGDPDPVVAVMEAWDPMKFDEILVSTLPTGSSRWLEANLPRRLEKLTSVPVRHVISTPKVEPHTSPAPEARDPRGAVAAGGGAYATLRSDASPPGPPRARGAQRAEPNISAFVFARFR